MIKRREDLTMFKNSNYLQDSNSIDMKKQFNFNIYDRQSSAERKSTDSG